MSDTPMERDAAISDDGLYRYSLTRTWGLDSIQVCWIMLNPSTADASQDDPTIRRCIAFSKRERFGSMEVVNLYAYRATNPDDLCAAAAAGIDIVGPANNRYIANAIGNSSLVICAWGAGVVGLPVWTSRVKVVMEGVGQWNGWDCCKCLGRTVVANQPRHPLYIRGDKPLEAVWR